MRRWFLAAVLGLVVAVGAGDARAQRDSAFANAEGGRLVLNTLTALNLDPMTIPLVSTGRPLQLYVTVGIEAVDGPSADRMRGLRIRVMDAVLGDLYGLMNRSGMGSQVLRNDIPQPVMAEIRESIRKSAERIAGGGTVREVVLGEARSIAIY